MATKLTKKQKGFVKDYVKTGNATLAVINNYEIESVNKRDVAKSIGSENLTKPYIQKAIADRLPDDLLAERHLELLNKREIIKMYNGDGVVIDQPDTQAVSKGLDMAYKVKGSYAPERKLVGHIDFNDESRRKANGAIRDYLGHSGERQ